MESYHSHINTHNHLLSILERFFAFFSLFFFITQVIKTKTNNNNNCRYPVHSWDEWMDEQCFFFVSLFQLILYTEFLFLFYCSLPADQRKKNWKILDLKFSGIESWLDADNNDALAKKKLSFSRTIICMSLNKIYVDRKKNFQSHQNKPILKSSRIESIWILKCKKKFIFIHMIQRKKF